MSEDWFFNLKLWEAEIQRKNKLESIHYIDEQDLRNYIALLPLKQKTQQVLLNCVGTMSMFRVLELCHSLKERQAVLEPYIAYEWQPSEPSCPYS